MDRLLIVSLITMVVWACSSQSNDDDSANSRDDQYQGFLLADDLAPGPTIENLDVADVRMKMDSSEFKYRPMTKQFLRFEKTDRLPDVDQDCLLDKLGSIPVMADKSHLVAHGSVQVEDCFQPDSSSEAFELIDYQHHLRVFIAFTCEDIDLSMYEGMRMIDIRDMESHPCQIVNKGTMQYEVKHEIVARKKFLVDGREIISEVSTEMIDAQLGIDENKPCRMRLGTSEDSQEVVYLLTCRQIQRDIVTQLRTSIDGVNQSMDETSKESFRQVKITSIAANPVTGRYIDGRMSMQMNNWTGDLIFKEEEQPANWILYSDNQTVDGKINPLAEIVDDETETEAVEATNDVETDAESEN